MDNGDSGQKAAGGGSYGSRWSERSERPPVNMARPKSTLEGVVDQIPSIVTLLRDRCHGRKSGWVDLPVLARFARTTGYLTGRLRRRRSITTPLSFSVPNLP